MTADLPAPLGAPPAARPDDPVCRACTHVHRVTASSRREAGPPVEVTYDQACGCGCLASGAIYGPDMGHISRTLDSDDKIGKPEPDDDGPCTLHDVAWRCCACSALVVTGADGCAVHGRGNPACQHSAIARRRRWAQHIDSDGDGADVGSAGVRLHPLAGEPDNTDRREHDIRRQRLVPVQRADLGSERRLTVRQRGSVRHAGRAERRGRVDVRRVGVRAVGWGRRVLGRMR